MHHHHADRDCCGALINHDGETRRGFLTLATLAAGVVLLSPLLSRPAAAGRADILLLTCMDYRLTREVADYMTSRGLTHQYDHVILAGASLGVVTKSKPAWAEEFWDHISVAKDLHHVKKLMVIDHRDCGAYKVFLGKDYGADPAAETAVHGETLRTLAAQARIKHPDLEIELLLMALDGKVEPVPLNS